MFTTSPAVPYLDLRAQYALLKGDLDLAVAEVVASQSFVSGPRVERFERSFAAYAGALECVAVGSGTDALHLALAALGIGPGDEVITQANTFIATLEAIAYTGARTVLVDVAPPAWTIDVDAVAAAITPRTRAIVPVHLFGQPADLDALALLAAKHGLAVIEDASQAHGARYRGKRIGARGIASWSFYPGKNLGAFGEAGGVTVHDPALAERMRVLRNHGGARKYVHEALGYNYRMDEIQGAVLDVKLPHLDAWNLGRRRVAEIYDGLLAEVEKPIVPPHVEHAYHVYPVFTKDRDLVRARLEARGIGTNVHYPVPCHRQRGYAPLGYLAGAFPHTERLAREELSLPIYPELDDERAEYTARAVADEIR